MSPPGGNWGLATIEGHRCELFQPQVPHEQGYVAIYLHDSKGTRLAEQSGFVAALERYGLTAVAPHTGRSWWTDRVFPEFDEGISAEHYVVQHVLSLIEDRWKVVPPRIALFGVGMGGQGALRLAYKHPNRFPVVAAMSPTIDFQTRFDDQDESLPAIYPDPEAARQDSALLYVHPLNWPRHQFFACDPADSQRWDSADRLRMKLSSLGIPFDSDLESSATGRADAYQTLLADRIISFLVERLEKERLRLI